MIVCPLSVLHNWSSEFEKFAPGVRSSSSLAFSRDRELHRLSLLSVFPPPSSSLERELISSHLPFLPFSQIPVLQYHGTPLERQEIRRTRLTNPSDEVTDVGTLGKGNIKLVTKKQKQDALNRKKVTPNTKATFPIVITSFEIAMKDAPMLRGLKWKYIIVDEGHRLKVRFISPFFRRIGLEAGHG